MSDWKTDDRPHRKGWAPGKYMGATCRDCGAKLGNCEKRAYQCADCAYADWAPTHRHGKTGGLYRLTEQRVVIEATMQRAVVYEGQDGTFCARPEAEFFDGRFATIDDPPALSRPSAPLPDREGG